MFSNRKKPKRDPLEDSEDDAEEFQPLRSRIKAKPLTMVEIDQSLLYKENANKSFNDYYAKHHVSPQSNVSRHEMPVKCLMPNSRFAASSTISAERVGTPQADTIPRQRLGRFSGRLTPRELSPAPNFGERVNQIEKPDGQTTMKSRRVTEWRTTVAKANLAVQQLEDASVTLSTAAKRTIQSATSSVELIESARNSASRWAILEEQRKQVAKEMIADRNALLNARLKQPPRMVFCILPTMSMEQSIQFFADREKKLKEKENKKIENQSRTSAKLEKHLTNTDGSKKSNLPVPNCDENYQSTWYVPPNQGQRALPKARRERPSRQKQSPDRFGRNSIPRQ